MEEWVKYCVLWDFKHKKRDTMTIGETEMHIVFLLYTKVMVLITWC